MGNHSGFSSPADSGRPAKPQKRPFWPADGANSPAGIRDRSASAGRNTARLRRGGPGKSVACPRKPPPHLWGMPHREGLFMKSESGPESKRIVTAWVVEQTEINRATAGETVRQSKAIRSKEGGDHIGTIHEPAANSARMVRQPPSGRFPRYRIWPVCDRGSCGRSPAYGRPWPCSRRFSPGSSESAPARLPRTQPLRRPRYCRQPP